jgi:hypothetical protein
MLTPSFSLTATERVLPKLALDFTTASLDARVTVTRTTSATNPATYVNSSGLVALATNNQPRFDYNPITLVCKGLLIEEARSNLILQSEDLSSASWNKVVDGGVTISANAIVAPDGNTTADKMIPTVTSGFHCVTQNVVVTTQSYSFSVFAKAGEYGYLQIFDSLTTDYVNFNLLTGVVGTSSAYTGSIEAFGNGWYRCKATNAFSASISGMRLGVVTAANASRGQAFSGNGSDGLYLWGAQLEAGTFATSYIPTTLTSLTRNADVVSMTGTNFSDWYSSSSAALAAVVIPNIATGTRPIWQLDDTTANEIIALRGNVANPELYIVDGGTPQAQLDAGTITAGTQYGLCAAFAANSCAVSQNGATPVTTATATMPTVTQARIGSDGSNFLNGAVRTLRYWPQRILNAETQAFSK